MAVDVHNEVRDLMDLYIARLEKHKEEKQQAKDSDDGDWELMSEGLQKECRYMIKLLFNTMKNLGILDEEEIEMGMVKKR